MLVSRKIQLLAMASFSIMLAVGAMRLLAVPAIAPCVDPTGDPAGCQPSTFKPPLGEMPAGRVNRTGALDPTASEADARAGIGLVEKNLHLIRNFEYLHWVPVSPSVKDAATGKWKDGDLDGGGDERSFAIGGNCLFVGHSSGKGRAMNVLKVQPNPEKQAPVIVGEIPIPALKESTTLEPHGLAPPAWPKTLKVGDAETTIRKRARWCIPSRLDRTVSYSYASFPRATASATSNGIGSIRIPASRPRNSTGKCRGSRTSFISGTIPLMPSAF